MSTASFLLRLEDATTSTPTPSPRTTTRRKVLMSSSRSSSSDLQTATTTASTTTTTTALHDSFKTLTPTSRKTVQGDDDGSLTVNKLQFHHLHEDGGLVGRDRETALLRKCLEANTTDDQTKQIILIHGVSGCGKSRLLGYLKDKMKKNGLYMGGKFDMGSTNPPYSAIATACGEMVEKILSEMERQEQQRESRLSQNSANNNNIVDFCAALRDELGPELSLLYRIVPSLRAIVDMQDSLLPPIPNITGDNHAQAEEHPLAETKERLKYAFQRLFRILSRYFQPLCLALDDVQWSDTVSLDVIESLIADKKLQSINIALSFRSDELNIRSDLPFLETLSKHTQTNDTEHQIFMSRTFRFAI